METAQVAYHLPPYNRLGPRYFRNEPDLDNAFWIKAFFLFPDRFRTLLRLSLPGLDEIDPINFALGVQHFDLWKHQPHPAGYPLYIFFGWIGYTVFGAAPETSLHVVSVLGGAMFVAAWFGIIRPPV